MPYLVLLFGIILFLSMVALLDPSHRRRLSLANDASVRQGMDAMAESIALIAAATASRFGGGRGPLLRVPSAVLNGGSRQDRPCLTPIECVKDKRCAGHCGCR